MKHSVPITSSKTFMFVKYYLQSDVIYPDFKFYSSFGLRLKSGLKRVKVRLQLNVRFKMGFWLNLIWKLICALIRFHVLTWHLMWLLQSTTKSSSEVEQNFSKRSFLLFVPPFLSLSLFACLPVINNCLLMTFSLQSKPTGTGTLVTASCCDREWTQTHTHLHTDTQQSSAYNSKPISLIPAQFTSPLHTHLFLKCWLGCPRWSVFM